MHVVYTKGGSKRRASLLFISVCSANFARFCSSTVYVYIRCVNRSAPRLESGFVISASERTAASRIRQRGGGGTARETSTEGTESRDERKVAIFEALRAAKSRFQVGEDLEEGRSRILNGVTLKRTCASRTVESMMIQVVLYQLELFEASNQLFEELRT